MQTQTRTILATAALSIGLLSAPGAHAALTSVLGGQAINDTDLNVTWVSNANLVATNTFGLATGVDLGPNAGVTNYGPSIINSNGTMTWGGALKWIAAMNAANYLNHNDWRLPTSDTCGGKNNSCPGSEMGHLFYSELGGVAGSDIATTHNANYKLFSNFQPYAYWSGTEYAPRPTSAMFFYFTDGNQGFTGSKNERLYALAIRPGQVAAVPVPAAAWLFGSGLLGLVGIARRRLALQ